MVSYRIIAVLALTAAGVIAAPCEAGNGNGAGATGVANAQNAQATGAAGNAMGGGAGGAGNAQGGAGGAGNAQATGGAGNAQGGAGGAGGNGQGGAGGNAQGGAGGAGNAQGGGAGGNDAACNPANVGDAQGPDNVGVDGAQFVTGICTSDANCASNCCVLGGGKDPNVAVCRNEPALEADESCGFSCAA